MALTKAGIALLCVSAFFALLAVFLPYLEKTLDDPGSTPLNVTTCPLVRARQLFTGSITQMVESMCTIIGR